MTVRVTSFAQHDGFFGFRTAWRPFPRPMEAKKAEEECVIVV